MTANPNYLQRKFRNEFLFWRQQHLTKRNFLVLFLTLLVFSLILPILVVIVLQNDYQRYILTDSRNLGVGRTGILYGITPASDLTTLRQQLRLQADPAITAVESGRVEKLIIATAGSDAGTYDPAVKIDHWVEIKSDLSLCQQIKEMDLERVVIFADQQDIVRILYICTNLGVDAVGFPLDLHDPLHKLTGWLNNFIVSTVAIWQVNVEIR